MITPRDLLICQSTGYETPYDLPATSLQGIQPLVALLVAGLQGIKPLKAFLLSQGPHTKNSLGVHKTYHSSLFFNLFLALLSPNS